MTGIYIPLALRARVIRRARGKCEYCQSPANYSPMLRRFTTKDTKDTKIFLFSLGVLCVLCGSNRDTA